MSEKPAYERVGNEDVPTGKPEDAPSLAAILAETLPHLNLPESSPDGMEGRRVIDIIVMADTLEHREEVSHVGFNFLVGEVCRALNEGLEWGRVEITQRWSQVFSRTYISTVVRNMGNAGLFEKGWHTSTDSESGRRRRLRTFVLNRSHPLVETSLQDPWASLDYQDEPVAVPVEKIPDGNQKSKSKWLWLFVAPVFVAGYLLGMLASLTLVLWWEYMLNSWIPGMDFLTSKWGQVLGSGFIGFCPVFFSAVVAPSAKVRTSIVAGAVIVFMSAIGLGDFLTDHSLWDKFLIIVTVVGAGIAIWQTAEDNQV